MRYIAVVNLELNGTSYAPNDLIDPDDIPSTKIRSLMDRGLIDGISDAANDDDVVLQTRTITAGNGLTGGGDLSANRTLSVDTEDIVSKAELQIIFSEATDFAALKAAIAAWTLP